jgi:bleomycin hydrolase
MKRLQWISMVAVVSFLACACSHKPAGPGQDAAPAEGSAPAGIERSVVEIESPLLQAGKEPSTARYETVVLDPVLEELREKDEEWQDDQGAKTSEIKKKQEEKKEKERVEKKVLVSSLPPDQVPGSPEAFKQIPHLPPVPQYYTGTCWSFATTSFLESEVIRTSGREIKLSEMATVYWEYLAKASRFMAERGDSLFSEGSEASAVMRIWKEQGAWPLEAFPGFTGEDKRHDHQRMVREMTGLLDTFKSQGMWDEASALSMLRVVLDRHLGSPPGSFAFEGKTLDPKAFMGQELAIDPDDYVSILSTLSFPFYTQGELDVPDNWWHDASYYNVPLQEFYNAVKKAAADGYSMVIAVDYSEPGRDADNDVMFIPDFDIPSDHIDQLAREYRLAHEVTTDDHGVHLVGTLSHAGHDWFLVKDSSRGALRGKHKGYFFVRDDYVLLKVLSFTVHRDAVTDLLAMFTSKATSSD